MHIAHYTTRRPIATSMAFLAVILLGIVSFSRLSVDLLPNITFPRLVVWTNYREAGPKEMEELVTVPVEETVSTVAGVRRVHSISKDGMSLVTVEFAWGTDMDFAALGLREKLDNLSHSFPRTVERPVILRVDPRARPIITLAVTGKSDLYNLYALSRDVFKRRFEQIQGIAMATVTGGKKREIQIDVDMARLTAFGLSLSQLEQALIQANDSRPGGSIKKGRYRYSLRTVGEFRSVSDIAATTIIDNGNNGSAEISIGEVATVRDVFKEPQGFTLLNGREAVGLLITKESGANTIRVAGEALKVVEELKSQYPEVDLKVVDNQATFISGAIGQVRQALILGGILAFVVLFFFLHDLRNPLNIAIVMPVSVIATFILMFFSGVSVNMISLGGLALGVGMLVDNSIVVLENIFRRGEDGLPLLQACVEGTREVTMAITASTFTTVAVFFPIIYVRGVAGQLFRDQSLTVSFSLLMSLVVAMTLLPMVTALWRRGGHQIERPSSSISGEKGELGNGIKVGRLIAGAGNRIGVFVFGLLSFWIMWVKRIISGMTTPLLNLFDHYFQTFSDRYENLLEKALLRGRLILGMALVALTIAILLGLQIDRRLMPEVEQHRFNIAIFLPQGSILQSTANLAALMEERLRTFPQIESIFSQIGLIEEDIRSVDVRAGVNRASIQVFLKNNVSTRSFFTRVRPILDEFAGEAISLQMPETVIGELLGATSSDIAIRVMGDSPDSAAVVMAAVRSGLAGIQGISQVSSTEDEERPEIRLVIDRQRAAQYDIRPMEIAGFIEQYMRGVSPTDLKDFDRKIPIILRAGVSHRQRLETLLASPIVLRDRNVPLSQVVHVEQLLAPAAIQRENQVQQRIIHLSISGRSLNSVVSDVENLLSHIRLPSGFEVKIGGQRQEMLASMREMGFAFILSFVLVFLILAAQFESLKHPFIVIFSVPLAVIGAIIGLILTGQTLNVMSLIGLVVLVGIVVNDAIIKVDFINQERRRGTELRDAILLAGRKRLRPIIMTTVTTALALLPMALGFGDGAELRRPLAITIIFGLSFATVLTLIVVPVIYQALERD